MSASLMQDRLVAVGAFTLLNRGSLRGFAKVVLPSGMILSDVAIHIDGGRAWVMPASKPMLDRNGCALRDAAGKIRYVPIVSFSTKAHRDRFSDAVIQAVRTTYPEVLA